MHSLQKRSFVAGASPSETLSLTSSTSQDDLVHAERSGQHETSFVILSDLHLDNHKILKSLESVLSVYEELDADAQPSLFVLCGNFRSRPFLFDGEATREYQGALSAQYALLSHRSLTPSIQQQTSSQPSPTSYPHSPTFSPVPNSSWSQVQQTPGHPTSSLVPLSPHHSSRLSLPKYPTSLSVVTHVGLGTLVRRLWCAGRT